MATNNFSMHEYLHSTLKLHGMLFSQIASQIQLQFKYNYKYKYNYNYNII